MTTAELREEFVRLLTVDSKTTDRRRKGFNQAIFMPESEPGLFSGGAIWNQTTLGMVMAKFDRAVRNLEGS